MYREGLLTEAFPVQSRTTTEEMNMRYKLFFAIATVTRTDNEGQVISTNHLSDLKDDAGDVGLPGAGGDPRRP